MSTAHVAPQSRYVRHGIATVPQADVRPRSAMTRSVHGARRRAGLMVVDGEYAQSASSNLATVVQIEQAPSMRQRQELLRREDPANRRRPQVSARTRVVDGSISVAELASIAYQAVRVGAAQLRFAHLVGVVAFVASVVGAVHIGLALQPEQYAGAIVEHSVQVGESVWSLAATVDTDRPLEDVVADIERMNDVTSALEPGQHVSLPAY